MCMVIPSNILLEDNIFISKASTQRDRSFELYIKFVEQSNQKYMGLQRWNLKLFLIIYILSLFIIINLLQGNCPFFYGMD